MRWDYGDNGSRWREVEAPAGLSTPKGLKDFNRATDNRTDAAFLALDTPSSAGAHPLPPAAKPRNENLPSFSSTQ